MLPPRRESRRPLAAFVAGRRAQLRPQDVGLSPGIRRRTPGLRREELAQLVGVGLTWLTWFEQGRDIQVSTRFLESLADALRLDDAERRHLFLLAQRRPPPVRVTRQPLVSPVLQRMLDAYPYPAFIKNQLWDVLAWNAHAALLFGEYSAIEPARRNVVRLVFTHPYYRQFMVQWERDASDVVARFRADVAGLVDDPHLIDFVAALSSESPEFEACWHRHELLRSGTGRKRFWHPSSGEMEFDHVRLQVGAISEQLYMVSFVPAPGASESAAKRLFRVMSCTQM